MDISDPQNDRSGVHVRGPPMDVADPANNEYRQRLAIHTTTKEFTKSFAPSCLEYQLVSELLHIGDVKAYLAR